MKLSNDTFTATQFAKYPHHDIFVSFPVFITKWNMVYLGKDDVLALYAQDIIKREMGCAFLHLTNKYGVLRPHLHFFLSIPAGKYWDYVEKISKRFRFKARYSDYFDLDPKRIIVLPTYEDARNFYFYLQHDVTGKTPSKVFETPNSLVRR